MRRLLPLPLWCLFAITAAAQSPSLTTIVGPFPRANGTLYSGSLTVQTQTFTQGGIPILGGPLTYFITNGNPTTPIQLAPNDTTTPQGTSYLFSFGSGSPWTCIIPTSASPVAFGTYCTPGTPVPVMPTYLSNLISPGANGSCLVTIAGLTQWGACAPVAVVSFSQIPACSSLTGGQRYTIDDAPLTDIGSVISFGTGDPEGLFTDVYCDGNAYRVAGGGIFPAFVNNTMGAGGSINTADNINGTTGDVQATETDIFVKNNNVSPGTLLNSVAVFQFTGVGGYLSVNRALVGTTLPVAGIVVAGAGFGSINWAQVRKVGQADCVFDGSTAATHWVGLSTSVVGACTDLGTANYASLDAGIRVVGVALSTNSGAGTYPIDVQLSVIGSGGNIQNSVITTGGSLNTSGNVTGATGDIQATEVDLFFPNATVGSTLNGLATSSAQAGTTTMFVTTTPGSITLTGAILGVVVAGAGNSGIAQIRAHGVAPCVFDGPTVRGDYVIASATIAGACSDVPVRTGGTPGAGVFRDLPPGLSIVGRSLSTHAAAGTYPVMLNLGYAMGTKPLIFSSIPACSSTLAGIRYTISDSSTTTLGATVSVGGGTPGIDIDIFCNGTNYIVSGGGLSSTFVQTSQNNTVGTGGSINTSGNTTGATGDIQATETDVFLPNQATTGTVNNELAVYQAAGAIGAGTSGGGGGKVDLAGIVVAGGGTTGIAQIRTSGIANCVFDGPTTAGDYVRGSGITRGQCSDFGTNRASAAPSSAVIGKVMSTNASAGTYPVLIQPWVASGTAAGNTFSSAPTCNTLMEGKLFTITDSPSAVLGAIVTVGGGTNVVDLFCNAVNWVVTNGGNMQNSVITTGGSINTSGNTTGATGDIQATETDIFVTNNAVGQPTSLNTIAIFQPISPVTVKTTTTGNTSPIAGIVVAGAGGSGLAQIRQLGLANCIFDGATTGGHWVGPSVTVNGDCTDLGTVNYASLSAGTRVVGVVMSTNASAGTYPLNVQLHVAGIGASGTAFQAVMANGTVGVPNGTGTATLGVIVDGDCASTGNITLTGVTLGDVVFAGVNTALPSGVNAIAKVTGAGTVSVEICNQSESPYTLSSATYKVAILR